MSETVVTVEPTVVDAALINACVRMDAQTTEVHAHRFRLIHTISGGASDGA